MEKICERIRGGVAEMNNSDIRIIWDGLAYYIREEMLKKRGVVVPGFGTFTYVERRIDIGNHKELVNLRPYLALSERFAQLHDIRHEKAAPNGSIPVSRVNFTAVSETIGRTSHGRIGYSRETVEKVISEAFTAIDHFMRQDGRVRVPFNGLGCLTVERNGSTKCKPDGCFEFSSDLTDRLPYLR